MKASSPFSWLFWGGRSVNGPSSSSAASAIQGTEAGRSSKQKNRSNTGGGSIEDLGVTEELKAFVKGFTVQIFKDFPHPQEQDGWTGSDGDCSNAPNVRKDLTDWQARHATLVLATVKEISQLRYNLCPRHLKEYQFWRIYFSLVRSYTIPYELHAIQKEKVRMMELKDDKSVEKGAHEVEMAEY